MSRILRILLVISTLGMAATAHAVTYDATNADSDIWHSGSSNHSLWLPGLLAAGSDWQINPHNPPGVFEYSDGKVKFSGNVTNENDNTATGYFEFFFIESKGNPKKELKAAAYTPGPVDTDTWTYFDFDKERKSSFWGTEGAVKDMQYIFTQRDTGDSGVKGQLGIGANGKNINLGFSAWLDWRMLFDTPDLAVRLVDECQFAYDGLGCAGRGDINIDLAAVPAPAAFWLFGTALIGFVGMSRRIKVG